MSKIKLPKNVDVEALKRLLKSDKTGKIASEMPKINPEFTEHMDALKAILEKQKQDGTFKTCSVCGASTWRYVSATDSTEYLTCCCCIDAAAPADTLLKSAQDVVADVVATTETTTEPSAVEEPLVGEVVEDTNEPVNVSNVEEAVVVEREDEFTVDTLNPTTPPEPAPSVKIDATRISSNVFAKGSVIPEDRKVVIREAEDNELNPMCFLCGNIGDNLLIEFKEQKCTRGVCKTCLVEKLDKVSITHQEHYYLDGIMEVARSRYDEMKAEIAKVKYYQDIIKAANAPQVKKPRKKKAKAFGKNKRK